jgi:hypothetical protein
MIDRAAILQKRELPRELVHVPEWGDSIYVRTLTGAEWDAFEASKWDGDKANLENLTARLCVLCVCDADGRRIFLDDDVGAVGSLAGTALQRIQRAILRLNRIGDTGELEKNSESGPSAASGLSSPSPSDAVSQSAKPE